MAYFLSLCQDLVQSTEQHHTAHSQQLSLNEIRLVYLFTFSRVVYFGWFVSWRQILSTWKAAENRRHFGWCLFLCSCSVRALRLASGWQSYMQMHSPSFTLVWQSKSNCFLLFTALMQIYRIKSDRAVSSIVWVTDSRHGGELLGSKYVFNKCFIAKSNSIPFFSTSSAPEVCFPCNYMTYDLCVFPV